MATPEQLAAIRASMEAYRTPKRKPVNPEAAAAMQAYYQSLGVSPSASVSVAPAPTPVAVDPRTASSAQDLAAASATPVDMSQIVAQHRQAWAPAAQQDRLQADIARYEQGKQQMRPYTPAPSSYGPMPEVTTPYMKQQMDAYSMANRRGTQGMYAANDAPVGDVNLGPQLATGLETPEQRAARFEQAYQQRKADSIARREEIMANSAGKSYGALPGYANLTGQDRLNQWRQMVSDAQRMAPDEFAKAHNGADMAMFAKGGSHYLTIPQDAVSASDGTVQPVQDYYNKEFWKNRRQQVQNWRETGDRDVSVTDLKKQAQEKLGSYAGKTMTDEGKAEYGKLKGALSSVAASKLRGRQQAEAYKRIMSAADDSNLDQYVVKNPEFDKDTVLSNGYRYQYNKQEGKWDQLGKEEQTGEDWANKVPDKYRPLAKQFESWKDMHDAINKELDSRRKDYIPGKGMDEPTYNGIRDEWLGAYNSFYNPENPPESVPVQQDRPYMDIPAPGTPGFVGYGPRAAYDQSPPVTDAASDSWYNQAQDAAIKYGVMGGVGLATAGNLGAAKKAGELVSPPPAAPAVATALPAMPGYYYNAQGQLMKAD